MKETLFALRFVRCVRISLSRVFVIVWSARREQKKGVVCNDGWGERFRQELLVVVFFFFKSFFQLLNRFEETAGKRRGMTAEVVLQSDERGGFFLFFSSWEEACEVQDFSFLRLCFGKVSSWIIQMSLICHFCFINKPPMISRGLPLSETWTQQGSKMSRDFGSIQTSLTYYHTKGCVCVCVCVSLFVCVFPSVPLHTEDSVWD